MKRFFGLLVLLPACVCVGRAVGADAAVASNTTNAIALEVLVADVLEHNPELSFYTAEIAAAKGGAEDGGLTRES